MNRDEIPITMLAFCVAVLAAAVLYVGVRTIPLVGRVDALDDRVRSAGWWACIDEPGVLFREFWSTETIDPAVHARDAAEIRRAKRECGPDD